jgi:hypothetical protein
MAFESLIETSAPLPTDLLLAQAADITPSEGEAILYVYIRPSGEPQTLYRTSRTQPKYHVNHCLTRVSAPITLQGPSITWEAQPDTEIDVTTTRPADLKDSYPVALLLRGKISDLHEISLDLVTPLCTTQQKSFRQFVKSHICQLGLVQPIAYDPFEL